MLRVSCFSKGLIYWSIVSEKLQVCEKMAPNNGIQNWTKLDHRNISETYWNMASMFSWRTYQNRVKKRFQKIYKSLEMCVLDECSSILSPKATCNDAPEAIQVHQRNNSERIFVRSESIFHGNLPPHRNRKPSKMPPHRHQKPSKIDAKRHSIPMTTCSTPEGWPGGSQNPKCWRSFYSFFECIGAAIFNSILVDFPSQIGRSESIFHGNLPPHRNRKPSKMPSHRH